VRTDVWALGVILYELLAGIAPFQADGATAVIAAITADAPRPLREHRPDVPEELERAVMKALEKNIDKRFATAEAFAEALLPFASDDASLPPSSGRSGESEVSILRLRALAAPTLKERSTPGWASSPRRRGGRRSLLARVLLAAAGMALLVGAAWSVMRNAPPTPTPGEEASARALSQPSKLRDSRAPKPDSENAEESTETLEPRAGERYGASLAAERAVTTTPAKTPMLAQTPGATTSPKRAPEPSATASARASRPQRPEPAKPKTQPEPAPRAPSQPTRPTPSPGRNPLHL
jgi:serine/threonine-protein kinase